MARIRNRDIRCSNNGLCKNTISWTLDDPVWLASHLLSPHALLGELRLLLTKEPVRPSETLSSALKFQIVRLSLSERKA